jgi:acyl-coenzyme A thioesterase PaaI-like protein
MSASMQNDSNQTAGHLQPNSQNCFVCGVSNPVGLHLRFIETEPGEVTAEVSLPSHFQGYPGITHGGIIAAMLDEVAGRSLMGNSSSPRFMFTASLKVRYRQNVPTGQPLRLVGKAGASKGRMAEASSAIYGPDGALLADAAAILVDVPEGMVDSVDLAALGWRVYEDEEKGVDLQ